MIKVSVRCSSLLLIVMLAACSKPLAKAFTACQLGMPSNNVVVYGRRLTWYAHKNPHAQSYLAKWMNAGWRNRYSVLANMGYQEPLKGVDLRIEDSNNVIDRVHLNALCRVGICAVRNVELHGRLECDPGSWEGAYSGILFPSSFSK